MIQIFKYIVFFICIYFWKWLLLILGIIVVIIIIMAIINHVKESKLTEDERQILTVKRLIESHTGLKIVDLTILRVEYHDMFPDSATIYEIEIFGEYDESRLLVVKDDEQHHFEISKGSSDCKYIIFSCTK